MAYKRFLAGLLLAISFVGIYSFSTDDDIIAKVQRQLDKWTESHPVEKVYLHLDKPYYTAGDDIWFKAYVIIGTLHRLSAYSGVLNVELINDQDSIKQSLKLQLNNGTAFGDLALPDTLHEGNYRIRAYTQYMLNAGNDYIFDKAISIGNVITNKVFTKTNFNYAAQNGHNTINTAIHYSDVNGIAYAGSVVTYSVMLNNAVVVKGKSVTDSEGNLHLSFPGDNPALLNSGRIVTGLSVSGNMVYKSILVRAMAGRADVQFFPEGGNMVNGIPAKVAFKAIGTDGLGVDIKGIIIDKAGNKVAVINTTHLGMGVFDLTPQKGNSYKAELTYPDGSKASVALPPAADNGFVFNIATTDLQNLKIVVATATQNAGQFSLVAQSGGKVYYAAKSKPGNTTFSTSVSKSKFPSGIVQFTLFSSAGEPLNERLVFIQNPDQLDLSVSADKQIYSPRQKVRLDINAKNKDGKAAVGSFSVAVTDETKVPVDENNENNILADLLLTSDLKGYVEQPSWYFNNVNDKTCAGLDVLMLTQGYHRYEWKEIMSDAPTADVYPREVDFKISGRITTPSGSPVVKGKVELINFDDGLLKLDTLTDANGRFAFNNLIFEDSVKFLIQARTAKKKSDVIITLDTIAPPKTSGYKNAAGFMVNTGSSLSAYAQNSKLFYLEQIKYGLGNHVISLKEVQIREKRNALKHSSNLNGPGNADQVLLSKDLMNYGCVRLSDCLQGRLFGVLFYNGVPVTTRGGGRMLIVIDGAYTDAGFMNNLNINDVQSIEVLRNIGTAGIYGGRGGNGVLVITTKRGDEPTYFPRYLGNGIKGYQPKGFYKARTFYSPQYDAKTNAKLADLRTTIFWKPDLITRDDGKMAIEYFNAGTPGTYRVVAEGVDADGNIGRRVFRYRVE